MPKNSPGAAARAAAGRTPRSRPRREPLSRQRILEKALELLGDDVDAGVSMRALASALDTAPMSLYRHIRNKDDLLDGVTSLVLDRLDLEVPEDGDWTVRALAWMHGVRSQLREHPSVLPLLRTHSRYAPAFLRTINSLLVVLRSAGFDDASVVRASREIMWFTFGYAMTEIRTRQAYPGVEVGAVVISAFPPAGSPETEQIQELMELLPHFAKGEADETFADGARHLVAGLAASLDPTSPRTS